MTAMRKSPLARLTCGLAFASLTLAGCAEEDQIRTYEVPTANVGRSNDPPVAGPGGAARPGAAGEDAVRQPARTLGAMVNDGNQTWFFKLKGPLDAVTAHEEEFRRFVESLKFAGGRPAWDVPGSWKAKGGSGMRMETFHLGDHQPPLELTVIPLQITLDGDKWILDNVNRWRGELDLPPLAAAELVVTERHAQCSVGFNPHEISFVWTKVHTTCRGSCGTIDRESVDAHGMRQAALKVCQALASLKFTVALFALAILLVFFGTLAQHRKDIWQVVHEYFRVPLWPSLGIAWIQFQDLLPPSFFRGRPQVGGSFPFPSGQLIGGLMAINLLAAHGLRFKPQARGGRLWGGVAVILAGILLTALVIVTGTNMQGLQSSIWSDWSHLWLAMQVGLGVTFLASLAGMAWLIAQGKSTWWLLTLASLVPLSVGSVFAYAVFGSEVTDFAPSSMRIIWQLTKGTLAGLVLLAGCVMVFRKRAGVVLLHAGVGLMMLSQVPDEAQMVIEEGETVNHVQDIRESEMAVVDPSRGPAGTHTVISEKLLKSRYESGDVIAHPDLPFDVKVVKFYHHSAMRRVQPDDDNPATAGAGLSSIVDEQPGSTGTDSNVDIRSCYVELLEKQGGKSLGTYLVTAFLKPQPVTVDGKTYDISMRFKREYKPYTITLIDVVKEDYVGTTTPKDYSSFIRLQDPTRNEDREIRIWMNNPLLYAGDTFYQSGYNRRMMTQFDPASGMERPVLETDPVTGERKPKFIETTTLQVVKNEGWMIPYVSCMIVATGMLAHFLIVLVRFLNRQINRPVPASLSAASPPAAAMAQTRPKKNGAADEPLFGDDFSAREGTGMWSWVVPLLVVATMGLWMVSKYRPPSPKEGEPYLYGFGHVPVTADGRVKPYSTLAATSLRMIAGRESFVPYEPESALSGKRPATAPATRWLLDVVSGAPVADKHKVFRIENLKVQEVLDLPRREGFRYSFEELQRRFPEFFKQASQAGKTPAVERDLFQGKILELQKKLELYHTLRQAHALPPGEDETLLAKGVHLIEVYNSRTPLAHSPMSVPAPTTELKWETLKEASARAWMQRWARAQQVTSVDEFTQRMMEEIRRENSLESYMDGLVDTQLEAMTAEFIRSSNPELSDDQVKQQARDRARQIPPVMRASFAEKIRADAEVTLQENLGVAVRHILREEKVDDEPNPLVVGLLKVLREYRAGDAAAFNKAVSDYRLAAADSGATGLDASKNDFETHFNQFSPFYYLTYLYLLAFILAALAWFLALLGWRVPVNNAATWLVVLTLAVHTFALIARIYISGRPPVTNLYSSAVFIGWGGVVFGLVIEMIYRLGIGNILAAVSGFATLWIAHLLAADGDTFTVLQAVLDTQFWLAIHVTCITLGYTATFIAGLAGLLYVFLGFCTPALSRKMGGELGRSIARIIYGVLCFAIFLSFVGTVLGGLWADVSWGRFWGWDPKENGALIIVLWNALVLHARWDGMVKDRGLAVLSIGGNIVTAWSWFGVNELGVGLHSYGFTEGVLFALALFAGSQICMMIVGCLPKELWWSFRHERTSIG
jgi:ABC-type transport system involved in cytochrome c biogenesis permease subunit